MKILLFIFILILSTCTHQKTARFQGEKEYTKITILHINDTHGRFFKFNEKEIPDIGGFAAMATLIKQIRKEVSESGGYLLFLHGGDINRGTPQSDLLNAEPDIKILNKMKLDAVVLGNHEFDRPLENLKKQMEMSNFPFLSANVTLKKDDSLIGKPFITKRFGNTEVHIVGLTTYRLNEIILPEIYDTINLTHPIEEGKKIIDTFSKNSLIIALTHLGVDAYDGKKNLNSREVTDIELVKNIPEIDIVIGGHSHTITRTPIIVNKTLILQAGRDGKGLGRLDLLAENGEVIDYRYRFIPINAKVKEVKKNKVTFSYLEEQIPENEEILDIVNYYLKKVDPLLSESVGLNQRYLSHENRLENEIALGNLITDAMAAKGRCDVAIIQGGGIRSSLPKGQIMIKHILSIHPFNNTINVSTVTGNELRRILEDGFKLLSPSNLFLQVSGMNLKVNFKLNKVDILKIKNKTFSPDNSYTLCTDNFIAGGGDRMKTLGNHKNKINTGIMVHDGLIEFIKNKKKINYKKENRIVID